MTERSAFTSGERTAGTGAPWPRPDTAPPVGGVWPASRKGVIITKSAALVSSLKSLITFTFHFLNVDACIQD